MLPVAIERVGGHRPAEALELLGLPMNGLCVLALGLDEVCKHRDIGSAHNGRGSLPLCGHRVFAAGLAAELLATLDMYDDLGGHVLDSLVILVAHRRHLSPALLASTLLGSDQRLHDAALQLRRQPCAARVLAPLLFVGLAIVRQRLARRRMRDFWLLLGCLLLARAEGKRQLTQLFLAELFTAAAVEQPRQVTDAHAEPSVVVS